jgi:hypothetical protein
MKTHRLDPTYFLTTQSYSWNSLMITNKEQQMIELIQDYEMIMFVEQSKRDGITMISKR